MPWRTLCQRLRNSSADQALGIDAGATAFFVAGGPGFALACEVWSHSGSEFPATATATVEDAPKSKSLRERFPDISSLEGARFICPSSKFCRMAHGISIKNAGGVERECTPGPRRDTKAKFASRETFSRQLASDSAMSLGGLAYRVICDTGNIPFNFGDFLELETVNMVAE
jgi:hypothetical protein